MRKRLGADVTGARVLEVGCGEGAGAQTLLGCFGAAHVTALDLDPGQIRRAERRLLDEERADVPVGDILHTLASARRERCIRQPCREKTREVALPQPPESAKVHLQQGIGYVTPDDEHHGRGPALRAARRTGLDAAHQQRIATHRQTRQDHP